MGLSACEGLLLQLSRGSEPDTGTLTQHPAEDLGSNQVLAMHWTRE